MSAQQSRSTDTPTDAGFIDRNSPQIVSTGLQNEHLYQSTYFEVKQQLQVIMLTEKQRSLGSASHAVCLSVVRRCFDCSAVLRPLRARNFALGSENKHADTVVTAPLRENLTREPLRYGTHFQMISRFLPASTRLSSNSRPINHAFAFASPAEASIHKVRRNPSK